jgi:predicted metalloendopeptidase
MRHLPWIIAATFAGAAVADEAPLKSGLDLSGYDRAVRPQDNLYDFSNGTWQQRTQIPPDLSNYGTFAKLDEEAQDQVHGLLEDALRNPPAPGTEEAKAADFYRSFLDSARIESLGLTPLAPQFARIDAIKTPGDVVRYIGYNQVIGVGDPMAWSAPQDAGDAKRYLTEIDQSGLTMPDRDYYLRDDAKYREYRQRFETYVSSMLVLAGASSADAARQTHAIVGIETRLAQAHWTKVQNRDPVKTYNKMDLATARKLAPEIDWRDFFAAVGAPVNEFVISQPSFISALGKMIDGVPVADWRTYFRYRLLDNYAPFLPARFDQLHFQFHEHVLSGVMEQRPRWKRAVSLLDGNIGEITGRMYVTRYFPPESKARMKALVGNLLEAYDRALDKIEWMGPHTREQAKLKLSRIMVKIGYPDRWRDYSALSISPDDLIGNVERSAHFDLERHAMRLDKPVDRGEWDMTPQTVNAYYSPTMNEIVFPAAILQPPFYDAKADDAVNYGGIGGVIGHEISHGFDDQGRQFDADGNLRDWWTPDDAARFKALTAALVTQYSAFTVLDGLHVNGELTLGENIADNSGVTIAYEAYRIALQDHEPPVIDGFSGPQRFFLGWAQIWRRKYTADNLRQRISVDPHSPNQFRANGVARDIDAFYDAFGVKPGDGMYLPPAQRVKIW